MGKPVIVLSVCSSDTYGGAARAAYRIHTAVRELGVDSTMFVKEKVTTDPTVLSLGAFLPDNPVYKAWDWGRNKVINQWQHHLWGRYPDREQRYLSDLRASDIGNVFERLDYDVLHLHWINYRFIPLSKLPRNKPVVWTLHDSWPFTGLCHLPYACRGFTARCGRCPALHSDDAQDYSHTIWEKKKKIYQDLDLHIVAPSHWMAECARSSSLLGGFDIQVIPNCIDTGQFAPVGRESACQRWGLDPGKKHILFSGMNVQADPNKGYDYLQNALKLLPADVVKDTELVLIGSKNHAVTEVGGLKAINLGFFGKAEDAAAVYSAADVTVVPSLSENLSYTIMESLACGTPVAAFNVGGNGDLITQQVNGYLAREKDERDLSEGIGWCLSQRKESLSAATRSFVLEHFSPETIARQYLSLYSRI